MTLEDQIRAMADARADEIGAVEVAEVARHATPDRRRRGWLIAAAAAVVIVAGLAVAVLGSRGDEPDTTNADNASELARWVPPGGVAEVGHGGSLATWFFTVPGQEVGLVSTPEDATTGADDDWTWISVGTFQPGILSLSEDDGPNPQDGHFEYRIDDRAVIITSERLRADDFAAGEERLRAAGADVGDIAREIASWQDDLDVIYSGPATPPPTQVSSEPEFEGSTVWWINEPDIARFFASYRWLLDAEGNQLHNVFAFPESGTFNQRHAALPAGAIPMPVSEREWIEQINELLGDQPDVIIGAGGISGVGAVGDEQPPTAEVVERSDGSWSIRLRFAAPVAFSDGGPIQVQIGSAIRLSFGGFQPDRFYESVDLDARLVEAEAQLYADAINRAATHNEDAAPYGPDNPSVMPGFGPCAANPGPTAAELDEAVHFDANRTPLDLDLDGVDDELLFLESRRELIARTQNGWTNWVELDATNAELVPSRDDGPAAVDLDGDGGLEFFVTAASNTAWNAEMVSFADCGLRVADGDLAVILIGGSGNSCLFGCFTRVTCTGPSRLVVERLLGVFEAVREEIDPDDVRMSWAIEEYTYADGVFTAGSREGTEYPFNAPPPDAPDQASSGIIDCSPATIVDPAPPPARRPECAGNSEPPADREPQSMLGPDQRIDVDDDGIDDDFISFIGPNDVVWFSIRFGDGDHTNAITGLLDATYRFGLINTPDGQIAHTDLTGNGNREVFVSSFGNTGRNAGIATLDGCELQWLRDERDEPALLTVGVGGNSCAPTGCSPRITCVGPELITEITGPVERFDSDRPLEEVDVRWATNVFRHENGRLVVTGRSETTSFPASDPPSDAPGDGDSDIIDCSP